MAFRKRNVAISPPSLQNARASRTSTDPVIKTPPPGVRPSPVDGRPTTSTGTPSLDALLAGHAGLALGNSILLVENGTTDYAGTLLRYYAAEGAVQGHVVHVVGVGDHWSRELPGLTGAVTAENGERERDKTEQNKMKIAWRYERLGQFGAGARGGNQTYPFASDIALIPPIVPDRGPKTEKVSKTSSSSIPSAFCHTFDLTKRLELPIQATFHFINSPSPDSRKAPFQDILGKLSSHLLQSPPDRVHRVVIPTLLSPALYPALCSQPHHVLQFLHSLRGLLRRYPTRLTAMITLPLELYPRSSALERWIESLSDGVMELTPFPYSHDAASAISTSGAATAQEDQPQGLFKIHRLPVYHERGGGGSGATGLGDDLAFTVSRRRFTIKPFSLPPVEGDQEAQQGGSEGVLGKQTKVDIEF
ncbi:MAG: hypothetical protein M1825_003153 [Sarcosagium campestre]|nr:MAG: hypothetical protein M1825_003153 [Sarcosagium campestre]